MEYSDTKTLEYQKYLGELDMFLKLRNIFLKKKKGDYIYTINKEGFIKKNKKNGKIVLKIVPPKYLDYEKITEELNAKKKTCLLELKRIRDKIINSISDPKDIKKFEKLKQEYIQIKEKIENYYQIGEQLYNISENKEKIKKFKSDLELLDKKQNDKFYIFKSVDYKSENWEKSSREYCMFMIENEKKKKNIHNQLEKIEFDKQIDITDDKHKLIYIKKEKSKIYSINPKIEKEMIEVVKKKKTLKKKIKIKLYFSIAK